MPKLTYPLGAETKVGDVIEAPIPGNRMAPRGEVTEVYADGHVNVRWTHDPQGKKIAPNLADAIASPHQDPSHLVLLRRAAPTGNGS